MRTSTIPIETGLICPCCGQPTRRQWWQPSLLPERPGHSQTDCTNPKCAGYYMTLGVDEFTRRYGKPSVNSVDNSI